MPEQHPSHRYASRRRFLTVVAGAAGVLAAGCRPLFREKAEPARPDPDVTATVRALDQQQALLAAYAAARRQHPGLAGELGAFSKRHEAHSAALRARLPAGHAKKRTSTPSASAAEDEADVGLSDLVSAEKQAAASLAAAALAVSPTLAQVLASISACAAAHVRLLAEVKG